MTDLFSAWMHFPLKLLTMQQAYFEAIATSSEAGYRTLAAMHANQSAAEAGTRAFTSWASLLNRPA